MVLLARLVARRGAGRGGGAAIAAGALGVTRWGCWGCVGQQARWQGWRTPGGKRGGAAAASTRMCSRSHICSKEVTAARVRVRVRVRVTLTLTLTCCCGGGEHRLPALARALVGDALLGVLGTLDEALQLVREEVALEPG